MADRTRKAGSEKLHNRDRYLEQALMFRDTDLVKVVTGIRRCGKSSLLGLVRSRIESEQDPTRAFVSVNLENREFGIKTADDLYAYCKAHLSKDGKTYFFLDEIQRIEGWHDVVNSMRVGFDCDIYLTGSNAFLLSGELATYLSGRYVEIKMLPLALSEYASFCDLRISKDHALAIPPAGDPLTTDRLLERYLEFGGMPAIASLTTTRAEHRTYLSSLYETVIVRDIPDRERNASQRAIQNPDALRLITEFLADNVGNPTSAKKIADTLTSAGSKISDKTVAAYIRALDDAYIFYPTKRFDLHGKAILRTAPKQYIVDTGLRSFLTDYRGSDIGRVFENAVYLQLLYEGWTVHVGRLYDQEVDFVCTKEGRTVYLQVTDELYSEQTRKREIAPLAKIRDNYEKAIVVRQGDYDRDVDGIRIIPARDFFFADKDE